MYTAPTDFTREQTYIVSFPVLDLSMCMYLFRYHYGPFRYLFGSFRCLFGPFRCLFGPFRSFWSLSVPFGVYSYRPALPIGLPDLPYFQFSLNLPYFLPFRHPSGCHPVIYLFLPCPNISEPQFLTFVIQLYRPYLPKFHTWFSCQNLNFLGIYLTLRKPNLLSIVIIFIVVK